MAHKWPMANAKCTWHLMEYKAWNRPCVIEDPETPTAQAQGLVHFYGPKEPKTPKLPMGHVAHGAHRWKINRTQVKSPKPRALEEKNLIFFSVGARVFWARNGAQKVTQEHWKSQPRRPTNKGILPSKLWDLWAKSSTRCVHLLAWKPNPKALGGRVKLAPWAKWSCVVLWQKPQTLRKKASEACVIWASEAGDISIVRSMNKASRKVVTDLSQSLCCIDLFTRDNCKAVILS